MFDMIIISGLSGSGKSVALQSLEDIGHYCIDNFPAVLLHDFPQKMPGEDGAMLRAAISIDSRNKTFLFELNDHLGQLEKQGISYRILFLESEEQKIVRRYSETRRKHPLTDSHTPLLEGIRREKVLLAPLRERASMVIDTTETTPHELRGLIRDFAGAGISSGPLLLLESFGFKHGTPREADFVFDVRCLPNPHWQEALRPLTGKDKKVVEFLSGQSQVMAMISDIFGFLNQWLPGFVAENRSYITVGIGCTGGQHRSVFICERLTEMFAEKKIDVQIRHRELSR